MKQLDSKNQLLKGITWLAILTLEKLGHITVIHTGGFDLYAKCNCEWNEARIIDRRGNKVLMVDPFSVQKQFGITKSFGISSYGYVVKDDHHCLAFSIYSDPRYTTLKNNVGDYPEFVNTILALPDFPTNILYISNICFHEDYHGANYWERDYTILS